MLIGAGTATGFAVQIDDAHFEGFVLRSGKKCTIFLDHGEANYIESCITLYSRSCTVTP